MILWLLWNQFNRGSVHTVSTIFTRRWSVPLHSTHSDNAQFNRNAIQHIALTVQCTLQAFHRYMYAKHSKLTIKNNIWGRTPTAQPSLRWRAPFNTFCHLANANSEFFPFLLFANICSINLMHNLCLSFTFYTSVIGFNAKKYWRQQKTTPTDKQNNYGGAMAITVK